MRTRRLLTSLLVLSLTLIAHRAAASLESENASTSAPQNASTSAPQNASTTDATAREIATTNPPVFRDQKLGLFAGATYLASVGENGAAVTTGARYALGEHLALSADFGWGLMQASSTRVAEDRWWVIPSAAVVLHSGRVRFDFGGGAGIGTASGYVSAGYFAEKPFVPNWAFQLFPTVRLHAMAAYPLTRDVDVFVRADVASLLFVGSNVGLADSTWLGLSIGAQVRLL